jgi:hypothetical protein
MFDPHPENEDDEGKDNKRLDEAEDISREPVLPNRRFT